MSYNANIVNTRPSNQGFRDVNPNNSSFNDVNPKNVMPSIETEQYYESTINKGEPMGLLLALTYPNTFTFQTKIHF